MSGERGRRVEFLVIYCNLSLSLLAPPVPLPTLAVSAANEQTKVHSISIKIYNFFSIHPTFTTFPLRELESDANAIGLAPTYSSIMQN